MNKGIAVYPGSFDPPTNGHLDLIERGSKMFEQLVVAVLRNSEKTPMFSLVERLEMLRQLTADLSNVRIDTFDGLMVEYAKSIDAMCVLRGIRVDSVSQNICIEYARINGHRRKCRAGGEVPTLPYAGSGPCGLSRCLQRGGPPRRVHL